MRSQLKSAIERTIIATGLAALRRRAMRGRTLVVAYHNVVPEGEVVRGALSLHLPQRQFAEQLDLLGEVGEVIPLSRVGDMSPANRPRFVITFDDAYAGALSAAVAELRRRQMPATIFVAPALFGKTTWWDVLADGDSGLTPEVARDHAMITLAGRRDAVLEWAGRTNSIRTLTGAPRVGTIDELRAAMAYRGLTLGSHSWSHANLSVLGGADLESEMIESAKWLAQNFGERYIPWLAYPYGLANAETERAAEAAGYAGALRVEGGWVSRPPLTARFSLPRFNVPRRMSGAGFVLRLSGVTARTTGTV